MTVPAKNEEDRIRSCLGALHVQQNDFDHVLLLLNNCTDDTLKICKEFAQRSAKIRIVQYELSGNLASAGEARRIALNEAAEMAGNGVVLTTDADAFPDENWVAANLHAIAQGADAVCGKACLDWQDASMLPKALRIDDKNEALLMTIQDEINAMTDPDPADPWPRHQHHSGASLAMRAGILRKAGGAPHVSVGEDRALIERLQLVDAKIRHAPEIVVRVSGRLEGRAEGGMAATLKRRMLQRDNLTDDRLEPTVDAFRRVLARKRLRAALSGREDASRLAEDLLVSAGMMRSVLRTSFFGAGWVEIQRASPILQRRPVEFSNLKREIFQAITLRDQLREEWVAAQPLHLQQHSRQDFSSDENAR